MYLWDSGIRDTVSAAKRKGDKHHTTTISYAQCPASHFCNVLVIVDGARRINLSKVMHQRTTVTRREPWIHGVCTYSVPRRTLHLLHKTKIDGALPRRFWSFLPLPAACLVAACPSNGLLSVHAAIKNAVEAFCSSVGWEANFLLTANNIESCGLRFRIFLDTSDVGYWNLWQQVLRRTVTCHFTHDHETT